MKSKEPARILFACIHNAGRSQMAAAFFNALVDPTKAVGISAGTQPASRVHPEVRVAMLEVGIDLAGISPQKLTAELAEGCLFLITMGCKENCPLVPGVERLDWPFEDPKGQGVESVRGIRELIRKRIETFIDSQGWQKQEK